jgi:hypothetical protein
MVYLLFVPAGLAHPWASNKASVSCSHSLFVAQMLMIVYDSVESRGTVACVGLSEC